MREHRLPRHVRDEMLVTEPLAASARNRGAQKLEEPIDIRNSTRHLSTREAVEYCRTRWTT